MMFDRRKKAASLRGFDAAAADIGDQLHLRHPLLSFDGDRTLYVARRFNWRDDQRALTVADPSEASELATLLPDAYRRPIESGEAVVVAGAEFVQAVTDAGIQLDGSEMSFTRIHESKCWISTATQESFKELQARLADEALAAFDEALGSAAREGCRLSERGNGALLVLRGCGTRWREDLAIRELAGAKQDREFDLYRRLLDGFEIELDAQPTDLHAQVERHIELAMSRWPATVEVPGAWKEICPHNVSKQPPRELFTSFIAPARFSFSVFVTDRKSLLRRSEPTNTGPNFFYSEDNHDISGEEERVADHLSPFELTLPSTEKNVVDNADFREAI